MESNNAIRIESPGGMDFLDYLERSLRDPFSLDLSGLSLSEVIRACKRTKSKMRPNYAKTLACLEHNLDILQEQYKITLQPIQITDIFWTYFIDFCTRRGLRKSTILTLCNQLRAVLNWAAKYNATVSPTYGDVRIGNPVNNEIALTADEVSRITYFDVDGYFNDKRKDYRDIMIRVRDMFVLSCNLFQRHSDMVRITPECFDRNIFKIVQQKTGNLAIVDIDRFSIEPKTTYRILKKYGYEAPYKSDIGNFNRHLHELIRAVGLDEQVRIEERGADGRMRSESLPKWALVSSHTARRTAITINVKRGKNVHDLRKCSGHTDLRIFDNYVRDNYT